MEDSAWGRLIGVLVAPVRTFQSIAARPTWGLVYIVTVLVSLGVLFTISQRFDIAHEIRQGMEQRAGGEVAEADVQQAMAMAETFRWVGFAFQAVLVAALYFLVALLFWLLLRFVAGSSLGYREGLATTVHGYVPMLLSGLLSLPVVLSRESIRSDELREGLLASNLAALAPEGVPAFLRSLLASCDIFVLWSVVLLTLGLSIVGKVRRGMAATVVVGLWLIWVLGKATLTSLTGGA